MFGLLTGCNNPSGGAGEEEPNLIVSLAGANARFAYPPLNSDLSQMNAVLVVTKVGAATGTEYKFQGDKALAIRVSPGDYTIELSLFYKNGSSDAPLAKMNAPEPVTVLANQVTQKTVTVTRLFAVSGVTVSPTNITVAPGETRQFSAVVTIDEALAQDVTWSVDATTALQPGTAINPSGVLSVDAAETATSITVKATSTLEKGLSSARVGSVMVTINPSASTLPDNAKVTVSGNYWVGQTLTASTANLSGGATTFQWKRDGSNIGTNSDQYVLDPLDIGKVISVQVTNTTDYTGTLVGALARTVQDKPSLPSTATVTISGTPTVGQTLTANTSTFPTVSSGETITYQWKRDGVNISGVPGDSYKLAAADADKVVSVEVKHSGYEGSRTAFSGTVTVPSVFNVATADEWADAVAIINALGNGTAGVPKTYTINVTGIFGINGVSANTFSPTFIDVTLNGVGTNRTISLNNVSPNHQGSLLRVGTNQTVTMGNLNLVGHGDNNTSLVYISGTTAKFTMNSGSVKGNTTTGSTAGGGGGVLVTGGSTFTMYDGEILDNKNNNASGYGGGVAVSSNGMFTMNGGKISGNTATQGGGVAVTSWQTGQSTSFTMKGGAVSGNTTTGSTASGGGVYLGQAGGVATFIMEGGAVSGNISTSYGGGVSVGSSTTFTMTGGEVKGNTANTGGGIIESGGTFYITNGTIYGTDAGANSNTASQGAALWANGVAEYGTFSVPDDPNTWSGTAIPMISGGYTKDATIQVVNGVLILPALSSIAVTTQPTKTTYTVGQALDTAGMVVTATYGDSTTANVTGWTTSGFSSASVGTHSVTVSYQGKTTTFSVTVSAYAPNPPTDATVIYVAATEGGGGRVDSVIWTQARTQINDALPGTSFAIIVIESISIAGTSGNTFTGNKTVYLAGQTGAETITWTGTDYLLRIAGAQKVTLDGLTLKGNSSVTDSMVSINGGTFTMNGGTILGNKANASGGGVQISNEGTFTMNGGEISDNIFSGFGGGVHVEGGTFTMSGGKISGNKNQGSPGSGGGVYVSSSSTFIMSGGEISGNTAINGGGVYVGSGSRTFMLGGTISGNTATGDSPSRGGGVYVAGTFRIMNGTVYGTGEGVLSNTASSGASNGAALYNPSVTVQRGTLAIPGDITSTWTSLGSITSTNNTIRVVNGALQ
jgi:hypothetical protein